MSTSWFRQTTCLRFHWMQDWSYQKFQKSSKLKKDKIEPSEIYIDGILAKNSLNGKEIWDMSSVDYVKEIIKNVQFRMVKEGMRLPRRFETPMSSDYTPELDASTELESDGTTMYQEII